jgi:hypothetical protein
MTIGSGKTIGSVEVATISGVVVGASKLTIGNGSTGSIVSTGGVEVK